MSSSLANLRLESDAYGRTRVDRKQEKNYYKAMHKSANALFDSFQKFTSKHSLAVGVLLLQSPKTNRFLRAMVNFPGADEVWCQQLLHSIEKAIIEKTKNRNCALDNKEFASTLERQDLDEFLQECWEDGIISRNQHVEMVKKAKKYSASTFNGHL